MAWICGPLRHVWGIRHPQPRWRFILMSDRQVKTPPQRQAKRRRSSFWAVSAATPILLRWKRLFNERTEGARSFRNSWQHQNTEAPKIVGERGQAWGALAWVKHTNNRPTGEWFVAVAGSSLDASRLTFVGPMNPIPRVLTRRIRLLHMGEKVYIARPVRDMFEAAGALEVDLKDGKVRLVGDDVGKPLPRDWVTQSSMYVISKPTEQTTSDTSNKGAGE